MAQDNYSVVVDLVGRDSATRPISRVRDSLQGLGRDVQDVNASVGGMDAAFAGVQNAIGGIFAGLTVGAVAQFGQQLYETGKSANRAEALFGSFSDRIGSSADMLDRLRAVSRGAVGDFQLMQGANQLLSMGLATNANELERMTNIAATFAQAMGTDVGDSVNQLALIMANQSYERLDALGISSGAVRELKNQYQAAGMESSEAFNAAFIAIAEQQLPRMSAIADETVTELDRLRVSWENFWQNAGQNFAAGTNAIIEGVPAIFDGLAQQQQYTRELEAAAEGAAQIYTQRFMEYVGNDDSYSADLVRGLLERLYEAGERGLITDDMIGVSNLALGALADAGITMPNDELVQQASTIAWWYQEQMLALQAAQEAAAELERSQASIQALAEGATNAYQNGVTAFGRLGEAVRLNLSALAQQQGQDSFNYLMAFDDSTYRRGSVGSQPLFTTEEAADARATADYIAAAAADMQRLGADETALAQMTEMAQRASDFAREVERGAGALENMTLPQALGQGEDTNELLSGLLGGLDLSGLADAQQRLYAQQFGLATGEETRTSLMMENAVMPRLQAMVTGGASPDQIIEVISRYEGLLRNMQQGGFSDAETSSALWMGPEAASRRFGVSLDDGVSTQGQDYLTAMQDAELAATRIDETLAATVDYPGQFAAGLDSAFSVRRTLLVDLDISTGNLRGPMMELMREIVTANNGAPPGATNARGRSARM